MDDKFNKTLDDDALDGVAGGTEAEARKDTKFLTALGIKGNFCDSAGRVNLAAIEKGWKDAGITAFEYFNGIDSQGNREDTAKSTKKNGYALNGKEISRHDAMIYAMRHADKYLNLEDYI